MDQPNQIQNPTEEQKPNVVRQLWQSGWLPAILIGAAILIVAIGLDYWKITTARVYTDKAMIEASIITLSPDSNGILEAVYVHEGDEVPANTLVARVGNELIKTKTDSLVISVPDTLGTLINSGQAVVTVINPDDLRVDGQVEDDKGLSDIQVGERASFTVDGFSKSYDGVVDEVSPTSHASDVVFDISDQRQISSFDVKVRFDPSAYPELKNGMSAKLWIYKN